MSRGAEPVVVVGAGIAGLCAAIGLARAGFEVEIFEQAEALREAGAGLQLSPNALRVLGRLGLLPALRAVSTETRVVVLRSGRSGRRIAEVPVEAPDGMPYFSLHRADLQRVLSDAARASPSITLRLGQRLTACVPRVDAVSLQFESRAAERPLMREARTVIGADGIRSAVAESLGLPPPVPARTTAWRMAVPGGDAAGGIEAWLGPGRHAVAYPVRQGHETNLVLIVPDGAVTAEAAAPQAAGDGLKPALLRDFRSWDPRLLGLVRRAGPATGWPLLAVDPRRPWVHGERLCLIGDAAHAMLPFAAQGAALAIEDGYVLAHHLASAPDAALRRFAEDRAARVARVRARVAFHRLVYHLPRPASLARDAVLTLRSRDSLRSDLSWLYDWQPPAGD